MVNLLTAFQNQAKKEDYIYQIALLRTITFANLSKIYGQKTATKVWNSISGLFSKEVHIDESNIETINDMLNREIAHLENYSLETLRRELRLTLRSKVNIYKQSSVNELSQAIINKVAISFNIDNSLTIEQKADAISQRFLERIISNLQKQMDKQTAQEKIENQKRLQKVIYNLSEDKRKDLQEALKVNQLTGQTLYLTMKNTSAAVLATTLFSSFGGYVLTTTLIHGVFTSLLGITLPFAVYTGATSLLSVATGPVGIAAILGYGGWKLMQGSKKIDEEMLAQFITMARIFNGRKFASDDEELPDWILEKDVERKEKLEQEALIKELQKQLQDKEKAYITVKNQYNNAIYDKFHQEQKCDELRHRLKIIEEERNLYKNDNEKLQQLNKEYEETLDEYTIYEDRAIKAEKRAKSMEEQLIKVTIERDRAINKLANNIKDMWEIHFPKFDYDKQFIKKVASFDKDIRLKLERVLTEIHSAEDPKALASNRGKLSNGLLHYKVSYSHRLICRIVNNRIELLDFCDHDRQNKVY